MRITGHARQAGDTIIEVLFAVAVFAMVAVGTVSIMNKGTAAAQRSLEVTLVSNQIEAQAEAIRYVHQAYTDAYEPGFTPTPGSLAEQWVTMTVLNGASTASTYGEVNGYECLPSVPGEHPFILNSRLGIVSPQVPSMAPPTSSVPPFARVSYNPDSTIEYAYGIWVEAVPAQLTNGDNTVSFVDFHIRACWEGPSSNVPVTLGTIVRLHDPKS